MRRKKPNFVSRSPVQSPPQVRLFTTLSRPVSFFCGEARSAPSAVNRSIVHQLHDCDFLVTSPGAWASGWLLGRGADYSMRPYNITPSISAASACPLLSGLLSFSICPFLLFLPFCGFYASCWRAASGDWPKGMKIVHVHFNLHSARTYDVRSYSRKSRKRRGA